jgi:WXXGXW repeat (2 copies)
MRSIRLFLSILLLITIVSASVAGFAQVGIGITVSFGPPALPVYVQPPCPAPSYIWTPGYWAYDPDFGYYWVPGTWVLAPQVGFFWTPGYWAWSGIGFVFYPGYWGPRVGFYGGINYGYGYFGNGYVGGRWDHGEFYYNRTVNNVNITNIHNVYNTTVVNYPTENRVSYNGGEGGTTARPTSQEEAAFRERHIPPVAAQTEHVQMARGDPQLRASVNQGRPPIAATDKPGSFKGSGVVAAQEAGAPYRPPVNRAVTAPGTYQRQETPPPVHAKDVQPHPQPAPPYTGNAKADQHYQQQQQKLYARQEQEHQKLAQQQEAEHQRTMQQQASQAQMQQMEQRHQMQTQQMEQKHYEQQQQLMRQAPPPQHSGSKPPPPR